MRLKYCVYVLISLKDKNLYVGYTTDLQERLTAHFKGQADSTLRPFDGAPAVASGYGVARRDCVELRTGRPSPSVPPHLLRISPCHVRR